MNRECEGRKTTPDLWEEWKEGEVLKGAGFNKEKSGPTTSLIDKKDFSGCFFINFYETKLEKLGFLVTDAAKTNPQGRT